MSITSPGGVAAIGAVAAIALFGPAAHASITRIADTVTGVSADGSVVSGFGLVDDDVQMIRWTASGGAVALGTGAAFDVSRDGRVLVGTRFSGNVTRAVRWTSETGIVPLGQIPGSGTGAFSEAYDVSGDGSVIVGITDTNSQPGPPLVGFRWTSATGMRALDDLPGGALSAQASAISADGQVTVGYATGLDGDRAVRWLGNSGFALDMGLPVGRTGFTEARHVSGDGKVVVGVWGNGAENEAFRWTESGGYELLGDLPGGIIDSFATATNFDGSVIVGTGNPGEDLPDEPFYWTREKGLRSFRDVLTDAGIDSSQWQSFVELRDLSDDGLVIGGTGVLLDGSFAGFRVVLPAPSSAAVLVLGGALAGRRRRSPPPHRRGVCSLTPPAGPRVTR